MLGRKVVAGAIHGLAVWLAYATVEFILASLLGLVSQPNAELNGYFWQATAMLLAAYAAIGLGLGSIIGALLPAAAWRNGTALLTITVPLPFLFGINLLMRPPLGSLEKIAVAIAALLTTAMLLGVFWSPWRGRLALLTGPMTASFLLLAVPWISQDVLPDSSATIKFGVPLISVVGFVLVAHWAIWRRRTLERSYLAKVVSLLAIVVAVSLALNPRSPALPARSGAASSRRPNVILIVMDTVRADHTSLYGYERDTTPILRGLAQQATLYTRAVAVSDMTLPSHASMFTGLYPRTHGAHYAPPVYPFGRPLDQKLPTLTEALRSAGYRTMAVVANAFYLQPSMGFAKGFEIYDSRAPLWVAHYQKRDYLRRAVRQLLDHLVPTFAFEAGARKAEEINTEGIRLLDQLRKDDSFFLFLNYMDAHEPYAPPSPFRKLYPCTNRKVAYLDRTSAIWTDVLTGKREIGKEEERCLVSEYDGGVTYIDFALGKLFANLKARGLYDNTMIIVTSDHGEAFGFRNNVGHGGISVYQDQISIPLIVKYPNIYRPARNNAAVSHVDLMPTVLDVLNIPVRVAVQGKSLRAVHDTDPRFVVSESYPNEWLASLNRRFDRTERAVLDGDTKLIVSTTGAKHLFDLSTDPREKHDLYPVGSPSATIETSFQRWLVSTPVLEQRTKVVVDNATLERLRSLGYVSPRLQ